METKPSHSDLVADYFIAVVKKLTVVPTDDGKQEYQLVITVSRNEATQDLADFVGQPVRLAIKSVQAPLPFPKPEKKAERVIDTVTGEIMGEAVRQINEGALGPGVTASVSRQENRSHAH